MLLDFFSHPTSSSLYLCRYYHFFLAIINHFYEISVKKNFFYKKLRRQVSLSSQQPVLSLLPLHKSTSESPLEKYGSRKKLKTHAVSLSFHKKIQKILIYLLYLSILPQIGIEPIREYKSRRILSPVRLPVPPLRLNQ